MDLTIIGRDASVGGVTYPWMAEHDSWLLRSTETWTTVVTPMGFNWRLHLILGPRDRLRRWECVGFWCYGRGPHIFRSAGNWNPEEQSVPAGWFRAFNQSGYDYAQPGAPIDDLGQAIHNSWLRRQQAAA